jgi:hypothetical protein
MWATGRSDRPFVCIKHMSRGVSSRGRKFLKLFVFIAGGLLIVLIAGYFIAGAMIHKKVDEALQGLPPALKITYTGLHPGILTGSLVIDGLEIRFTPQAENGRTRDSGETHQHQVSIDRVVFGGIHFFKLLRSHSLILGSLRVEGVTANLDEYLLEKNTPMPKMQAPPFTDALIDRLELTGLKVTVAKNDKKDLSLEGSLELDSVHVVNAGVPGDTVLIGGFRFLASTLRYSIPGADEVVRLSKLEVDSKKRLLRLDTMRIRPTMDREEIGRAKGHQVDVFEAASEGITVDNLDVMALMQHRLTADQISIHKNTIHVFRDRRLPLEPGDKAMPVEGLKSIPVTLRVGKVKIGTTTFEYEEFPKKGDKTGTMKIFRLTGTMEPLINKPVEGDPAYITMTTEGSLMNSGTVTATTKMPLHKGDSYKVQGAFHDLDVTKLNNPAENLGKLHLESGMLNSLAFQFEMTDEKATGQIIGEYHDLVVDKLKENSKVDKAKSFALAKFIIPKDKDKSLAVSKRTGKVDYKHDPNRYFSYYLLHALLVGVKSSFKLGFLLPG